MPYLEKFGIYFMSETKIFDIFVVHAFKTKIEN